LLSVTSRYEESLKKNLRGLDRIAHRGCNGRKRRIAGGVNGRLGKGIACRRMLSLPQEHDAESKTGARVGRSERECAAQFALGRIEAPEPFLRQREIVVRHGVRRIDVQELSEVVAGRYCVAGLQRKEAARVERSCRTRIECNVAVGNFPCFT